ncbi:MAG: hypothetical protein WBH47_00750, partial [Streptosporangiaceae bacterium]
ADAGQQEVNGAGHAEVGGPIDQPAEATSPNGELAAPEGEPAGMTTGGGAATVGRRRSGRTRRSATRAEGAAAPDNRDGQQAGD